MQSLTRFIICAVIGLLAIRVVCLPVLCPNNVAIVAEWTEESEEDPTESESDDELFYDSVSFVSSDVQSLNEHSVLAFSPTQNRALEIISPPPNS